MGRLFGTNGVRGIVGQDMVPELALRLATAIGASRPTGRIALGQDARTSSEMLAAATAAGLSLTGQEVVRVGFCSTPALQFEVKGGGYQAGVMITASHNPPEFNGIKVIDADGTEVAASTEDAIETLYFAEEIPQGRVPGRIRTSAGVNERYATAALARIDPDLLARSGLAVVLDCGNGASCAINPLALRQAGIDLITLNAQADGAFPGHPSEPVPKHLGPLMGLVRDTGAALGIVHDGDADRAIFIDEQGRFVPGDLSLALFVRDVLERQRGATIVTPIATSNLVRDLCADLGGELVITRVGAPIVARTMIEHGSPLGGEENGGVIFGDHQFCRDALMSSLRMVELLVRSGKLLSELLASLPEYHQHKESLPCSKEQAPGLLEAFAQAHAGGEVETMDGVRVDEGAGWTLVRPSGTEPIMRIYAEDRTPEGAAERTAAAMRILADHLG